MYSEEKRSSSLAKFLSEYDYVLLDTCSLMEDGFPNFMDTLAASKEYWKDGLRVVILEECIKELKKHCGNNEKNEARIGAKRALKILRHNKWHGKTIEILKGVTEGDFADQAITQKIVELRIKNKILVITQDKTLTSDLLKLNKLDSQHGRYLDVYKIMPNGELARNFGEIYTGKLENKNNNSKKTPSVKKDIVTKENKKDPLSELDHRLNSILKDPQVKANKKIAVIDDAIKTLTKYSDEDKKSFSYKEERLLKEKEQLLNNVEPKLEKPKLEAEVKKDIKNISNSSRVYYDNGNNPSEAIYKLAQRIAVLIRDDSVAYFPMIHGPLDLTTKNIELISKETSSLKPGEKKIYENNGNSLIISHEFGHFRASFAYGKTAQNTPKKEDNAKKPPKTDPKSEQIKEEKKAINTEAKREKVSSKKENKKSKKEEKTDAINTVSKAPSKKKDSKKNKKESSPIHLNPIGENLTYVNNAVLPEGVSLEVIEPLMYRPFKKSGTPKKASSKKSVSKKEAEAPSKAKSAPKKEKAKSSKKGEVASLESKKENAKSNKFSSKETKKKENPELLLEAKAAELRLNANINNPTYPLSNKLDDLNKQLGYLKKLSTKEKKELKLSTKDIQDKIKELHK